MTCTWQVIGRNGANFTKDGSIAHANLASLYLKLCDNHLFQLQVWAPVENKLARATYYTASSKFAARDHVSGRPMLRSA